MRQAGGDVDLDTVHTTLGLGMLVCAAGDVEDVRTWYGYARDAFLVDGGRALGLTIRPMHPPEAARGLADAAEFRQHFDASYRPLVLRALEHEQQVVAWCAVGGGASRQWALITETCSDGLGFRAERVTNSGSASSFVLELPPWQLYVIERCEPRQPDHEELGGAIVRHAHSALDGSLDETFGVVTGAAALVEWAARLTDVPSNVSAFADEHAGFATDIVAGLHALLATLDRIHAGSDGTEGTKVDAIHAAARKIVEGLTPLTDAEAVSHAIFAPQDVVAMRDRVTGARKTLDALATALA